MVLDQLGHTAGHQGHLRQCKRSLPLADILPFNSSVLLLMQKSFMSQIKLVKNRLFSKEGDGIPLRISSLQAASAPHYRYDHPHGYDNYS
jgi:hypothetical protein